MSVLKRAIIDIHFDERYKRSYLRIHFTIDGYCKTLPRFLIWSGSLATRHEKLDVAESYARSYGFDFITNYAKRELDALVREMPHVFNDYLE